MPFDAPLNANDGRLRFCGRLPATQATSVMLVVQPRGPYLFLDEIEFTPQPRSVTKRLVLPVHQPALSRTAALQLQETHRERFLLRKRVAFLVTRMIRNQTTRCFRDGDVARLTHLAERLAKDDVEPDALQLEEWEKYLYGRVAEALRGKTRYVIWATDAWSSFTPVDCPDSSQYGPAVLTLDLIERGYDAAAFAVASTVDAGKVRLRLTPLVAGNRVPSIKLYNAAPVQRATGEFIADALIALADDGLPVPAGRAKQIFVSANAASSSAGHYPYRIEVIDALTDRIIGNVQVVIRVWPAPSIGEPKPFVNSWAYLNWRPLRGAPAEAIADLKEHGVNVLEFGPSQLPWPIKTASGVALDPGKAKQFSDQLALARQMKFLILYLNLREPDRKTLNGAVTFGTPEWGNSFRWWVAALTSILQNNGFRHDEFAFFPLDEPETRDEVETIGIVSRAIKEVDERLLVFTTMGKQSSEDVARHASSVDIFQTLASDLEKPAARLVLRLGKRLWSYTSTGGGKQGHPLHFFRKQAWTAFMAGAEGFGFWSYADTGSTGSAWVDSDGDRPDMAVIYEGPGGSLISSKRWEAWRTGVEDYALLVRSNQYLSTAEKAILRRGIAGTTGQFAEARDLLLRRLPVTR